MVHAQFNGHPDSTFGANGIALFDNAGQYEDNVKAVYGTDDKLYVAGTTRLNPKSQVFIIRYNQNGTLDPTFGINGKVLFAPSENSFNFVSDIKLTSENKIVISGYSDFGVNFGYQQLLARFNNNGSLDQTFNQQGYIVKGGAHHDRYNFIWIEDDGKIIVAGNTGSAEGFNLTIEKYNTNGTLDNNFGFQGTQTFDFGDEEYFVAIEKHNNNYYVAAEVDGKPTIISINSSGQLNAAFGDNGKISANFVNGYYVRLKNLKYHNNHLFICGFAVDMNQNQKWDVLVAKLDLTGKLSNTFGSGGYFRADLASTKRDLCNDIDILADGSILGVGTRDKINNLNNEVEMMTFMLALDGTLYSSYGTNGVMGYNAAYLDITVGEGMCKDNDNKFTLYGIGVKNNNEDALIVKLKTFNSGNISTPKISTSDASINFYPNPIHDKLNVEFKLSEVSTVNINLCNINGKVIKSLNFNSLPAGSQQLNLNEMISEIPAGVYYISVESTDFNTGYKILKY